MKQEQQHQHFLSILNRSTISTHDAVLLSPILFTTVFRMTIYSREASSLHVRILKNPRDRN